MKNRQYAFVVKWISRRSTEPLFWVRVPADAPKNNRNKICGFLIRLKRDENPESIGLPKIRKYFWEKVGVPHRLYNLWGDKQTSERGGFANSKSPRTKIATPSPGRRTKFMERHLKQVPFFYPQIILSIKSLAFLSLSFV